MTKHNLTVVEGKYPVRCDVCGASWKSEPVSSCPGVKVYEWGKWGELLTKKQMDDAGFQTGAKLPAPVGAVLREKSPGGIMWLYDRAQGVPKNEVSEAQRAALQKANEAARLVEIRCSRCHMPLEEVTAKRAETMPPQLCFICRDHDDTVKGAREWLRDGFLILDTETTGLASGVDEIVEIAVIDHTGTTLLNTRIKPQQPERLLAKRNGVCAFDIHGIHPDALTNCPTFPDIYPQLSAILKGKTVLIYNKAYDTKMLNGDCRRYGLEPISFTSDCVMELYAQWHGEWNSYHESYRWQKLEGGDHSALGDCLSTLKAIKTMAGEKTSERRTH